MDCYGVAMAIHPIEHIVETLILTFMCTTFDLSRFLKVSYLRCCRKYFKTKLLGVGGGEQQFEELKSENESFTNIKHVREGGWG